MAASLTALAQSGRGHAGPSASSGSQEIQARAPSAGVCQRCVRGLIMESAAEVRFPPTRGKPSHDPPALPVSPPVECVDRRLDCSEVPSRIGSIRSAGRACRRRLLKSRCTEGIVDVAWRWRGAETQAPICSASPKGSGPRRRAYPSRAFSSRFKPFALKPAVARLLRVVPPQQSPPPRRQATDPRVRNRYQGLMDVSVLREHSSWRRDEATPDPGCIRHNQRRPR